MKFAPNISIRRIAATPLIALVVVLLFPSPGSAVTVQRVVSPGGIEAWLVEDHTNPLIAVDLAFKGGAAQEPAEKAGLARMVSSLLDEGAGDLDSTAFQLALEDDAIRLSFRASGELFNGSLTTLLENRDRAFDLLRLAITEPRFDTEPVERIRGQIKVGLRRNQTDPDRLVALALFEKLFPGHPYGRTTRGTPETIDAITIEDLKAYHARVLARDTLKIGVVGAIDAETLSGLLDRTFGGLPAKADLRPVAETDPATRSVFERVEADVPQSAILFAMPGLKRDDPDFMTAYVVNHIFGGGSFSSRLYEEVREKRGLVYSVYSYLYPFDHSGILMGGAGTENTRVDEALDVVRAEITRMGETGPGEEELENAKRYLIGAYPLRFDTSAKIAGQLVAMQVENLGIDYIEKRNALVSAVTFEDARRVAKALFQPDRLAIAIAGRTGTAGQPVGESVAQ